MHCEEEETAGDLELIFMLAFIALTAPPARSWRPFPRVCSVRVFMNGTPGAVAIAASKPNEQDICKAVYFYRQL